jgi:hypothetical protein
MYFSLYQSTLKEHTHTQKMTHYIIIFIRTSKKKGKRKRGKKTNRFLTKVNMIG